jgi:DNA-binding PadR family transcriptional regulator
MMCRGKEQSSMRHHDGEPFFMSGRGRTGGRGHAGGGRGGGGPLDRRDPRDFPGAFGVVNPFRRGPRARRGDIRHAILALLGEQPRNGYQIMQELEQRSRGMWRPSPGAVYPALQQLEDERLVAVEASGGGRVFHLTEKGKKAAAAADSRREAPWQAASEAAGSDIAQISGLLRQLAAAALQVAQAGSTAQVQEARRLLSQTRKSLYRLLADDDGDDGGAG